MSLEARVARLEQRQRDNVDFAPLLRAFNAIAVEHGEKPPFDLSDGQPLCGTMVEFRAMVAKVAQLRDGSEEPVNVRIVIGDPEEEASTE